jgi:3'-5' exoribonuclease
MKSPFVSELEANRVVTSSFLVHSKEVRQKKSGEIYLSLMLADRTGELDSKMWDNAADVADAFDRDDFIQVKGMIQIFHNRPQMTIHKLRRMDESEIDFADYFPASRRDSEEMWRELNGIVAGIGNAHLKSLLIAVLSDEEIARRYRRAPAAKQIHHAFLGGLIEHVLSLCALARMTASNYPNIDVDLLLTGVVLHDIGKIYELNYERGFSYSNEGQLIGHITIAMRMIADKLAGLPEFPRPLRTLVEHMVLSHHGRLEYGSPKVPQFPEALLLHHLDDLDSKMECMRALIERDRQVEGCFTGFNPVLERSALKKDRFLNPVEVAVRAATPAVSHAAASVSTPAASATPAAAPAPPQPSPAQTQAPPQPAPRPHPPSHSTSVGSFFADKLKSALKGGS